MPRSADEEGVHADEDARHRKRKDEMLPSLPLGYPRRFFVSAEHTKNIVISFQKRGALDAPLKIMR